MASRDARQEAADTLCEVLREYVVEHGCEIALTINEIPSDQWERQTGRVVSDFRKRELVHTDHTIDYWRRGG